MFYLLHLNGGGAYNRSKTIRIFKAKGLRFALVYNLGKKKRAFQQTAFYQHFFQKVEMLFLIFISHNPHKFGVYKILKRFHIVTTHNPTLVFISQYYEEINSWIESIEFKEQYLETNHPYPPMLNPKRLSARNSKNKEQESLESKSIVEIQPYPNLSYNNLSAQIAWDLNLPLPPYYQFVYWGSHGSGSSGLTTFLEYCGVNVCPWQGVYGGDGRENYLCYFHKLTAFHNDSALTYLSIREFVETASKFYALLPYSKALLTARDPISNLKSFLQLRVPKEGWDTRAENPIIITLQSEPKEVCKNLVGYWNMDSKGKLCLGEFPSFECIEYFIDTHKYAGAFHDTQLKNALINLQDSIIIDMSEIVGERAFETMKRLSQSLGFPAPREEERERFKTQRVLEYINFLPITLKVKILDTTLHFYLRDNALKTDYQNLTPFLFNQDCFYQRIIVCANKEDFEILKQDINTLEEVKAYLLKFIQRLQEQKDIEDTKKITESQVLEYLREHKDLRIRFKHILDEHLAYIKKERPDIVESWKYYQEFERMCENGVKGGT
ncbi:DUF2972 domain-containing protein [Helicobacter sp. MIT 21-1697]|uniref:DUF2972 domain-containing protein n=1 Tax=Helicobacter sp. MIT 21-1697 TaxID=2993733 RepID=UPI00224AE7BE|nr:DUF2972 domain-containing protein [Helicobacter sp. MIT 21-1697]MCX2716127.1 DUF2972 domain-containing protein [Helicobacter sp. MIT 21-1697]